MKGDEERARLLQTVYEIAALIEETRDLHMIHQYIEQLNDLKARLARACAHCIPEKSFKQNVIPFRHYAVIEVRHKPSHIEHLVIAYSSERSLRHNIAHGRIVAVGFSSRGQAMRYLERKFRPDQGVESSRLIPFRAGKNND